MIRFPLEITKQELPPKPESRTRTIGQAVFMAVLVLLWVYVLAPAVEMWMNG